MTIDANTALVQKLVDAIHGVRVLALVNYYTGVEQVVKEALAEADAWLQQEGKASEGVGGVTGETSDGYHTFNELYEHRHALFRLTCVFYGGWKSKLHDDGTMFDGWFIAGVETPEGQVTYHLPLRLWDSFYIRELGKAPKWDGHTSSDVVSRLATLATQEQPLAQQGKRAEGEDCLRSVPGYHEDNIEQLAFELAFELEEANLNQNDLVTVNRDKLKTIARRIYARLSTNPPHHSRKRGENERS